KRTRSLPDALPIYPEQPGQLIRREKVEEHEHVGLLGKLVAVRVVPFRFQDPVQALDVAVTGSVARPIELEQEVVALELADDAIVVEANADLARDPAPPLDLLLGSLDAFADHVAPG